MEHNHGKYDEIHPGERAKMLHNMAAHLLLRLTGAGYTYIDAAREIAIRHFEAARDEFSQLITRDNDENDKEDSKK